MFRPNPYAAMVVAALWPLLSVFYYTFYHLPPALNVVVNAVSACLAVAAIALLPATQYLTKLFLVTFALAVGLSSLQVSYDQPALTPEFAAFVTIHIGIFAVALAGSCAVLRSQAPASRTQSDPLINFTVYLFVGIAFYVALSKGVRLTGFLDGIKTDGDLYRIAGLSGLQGTLLIFLLCSFSALNRTHRAALIAAVIVFAMLDVKRGDIVRLILFLLFYASVSVSMSTALRKRIPLLLGLGIGSVVVLIIGGEVRQSLYSAQFSVSNVLDSRIGRAEFDWLYGYFGINISVLQQQFYATGDTLGYFRQILQFAFNAPPVSAPLSINGFNAGTMFATFAGNQDVLPSMDFLMFCGLFAAMATLANLSRMPSLQAFVMLQTFIFVFANQLILPYYLAGFFAAIGYQWLRSGSGLSPQRVRHT